MATESTPQRPTRFPGLLHALFREAWRLRRRRRRRWALVALVACAGVAGAVFAGGRGGQPSSHSGAVRVERGVVVSRSLPALGDFPELSVARGRLIVSGTDYNVKLAAGRVLGTCAALSVDPHTLRVVSAARGNCGNPALYGERVLPVVHEVNLNPGHGWGTDELGIRIAVVDRSAPAGYTLGPLLVGYPDCSDCRAQIIKGAGALWIYAPLTSPGAPGELLRISEATGLVTHRWVLPVRMLRVLLATDDDGLWFAPGVETCCSAPRSSWVRQQFLYFVAANSRAPRAVLDLGQRGASWLVASGHTVWVQGQSLSRPAPRWQLDRTGIRATLTDARAPQGCFDLGEGSPIVLGSSAIGIYCVTSSRVGQSVVRVDPGGRGSRVVASIPTTQEYAAPDSAVTLDGSYYFLDPPNTVMPAAAAPISTVQLGRSPAVLYRVKPR